MNGLMADCAIGKGRALVIADADLLRDASWFGPGAQGESRGARIADNGHLVSAAAQMLLDGQDSMSASDVRWMTRSEEHTSELPSLLRISYAVFCLKKHKEELPI